MAFTSSLTSSIMLAQVNSALCKAHTGLELRLEIRGDVTKCFSIALHIVVLFVTPQSAVMP